MQQKACRVQNGAAIMEYGGALMMFVCFLLIPLIDIGMIPIRHFFAAGTINDLGYRMGHCKKRSDAYTMLTSEAWWKHSLNTFGVNISNTSLTLIACAQSGEKATFSQSQTLPPQWLPNGTKGPCIYSVNLNTIVKMNPIYLGKVGLPGFNTPITFDITSRSSWENLGCDPNTLQYYINE